MLEDLLELLLHAKSGVVAAVFLIGTTGALVTASVSGGVTTITITQASPTASASISPGTTASPSGTVSASTSPSPSGTVAATPSRSPRPSRSPNACEAQAKAAADAVKTVDRAFNGFHTDLEHLRTNSDAARKIVEDADKQLKTLRQNAVKAIHATNTCANKDDEDKDNDEDNDADNDGKNSASFLDALLARLNRLFGQGNVTLIQASPTPIPSPTPSAPPSGTIPPTVDPTTIAKNAIAAMQLVFDDAKSKLAALPTASPRPNRTPEARGTKAPDKSGKNEHERD
ncbi:MAG TPA: hypothetical protein VJQ09_05970 [Candidatus Limnocylindria bacterium]|nr:hypothetical protein [Candidatus Limnocylindria bacterium]